MRMALNVWLVSLEKGAGGLDLETQRSATGCGQPAEAGRGWTGFSLGACRGTSLLRPEFWVSGLQNCGTMHFCRPKPPVVELCYGRPREQRQSHEHCLSPAKRQPLLGCLVGRTDPAWDSQPCRLQREDEMTCVSRPLSRGPTQIPAYS